ncbi:arginase family protein [Sphingobacterium sp. N143]|uniref:arginase family protein n=1 Tax=Sphingobacterium sp. N143 TaxID=2746727 RepID=UPI001555E514|nr:arginase family protein [Sphingobacterium sp. N143]MDM1295311.1 arginase family protein [Sphingobacterium sp. N143]NPE45489.1 arginase family protein [Sphingobacterium prati]
MKNNNLFNNKENHREVYSTLRLLFPQWQGGNNAAYIFGSEMLDWLAPHTDGPVEKVTVQNPSNVPLEVEDGIVAKEALLTQAQDARKLIEKHNPERIVILGGDCLVSLSPFAYLNKKYNGDLAILWVDTHPDVMNKSVYQNGHAMVMGNLLGQGDEDFVNLVPQPVKPSHVMFAGVRETLPELPEVRIMEKNFFEHFQLRSVSPEELANNNTSVIDWLKEIGVRNIAIHVDLDVLDPKLFRSLLFSNPDPSLPSIIGSPSGGMTMTQVTKLLSEVSEHVEVVGLSITEHLPWDAMALKNMLSNLPLIGGKK